MMASYGMDKKMRLFGVSDLHVDFPENWQWCQDISSIDFQEDAIIIDGDVSHLMSEIEKTLQLFKGKFKEVFFIPGNHELWIVGPEKTKFADSVQKFEAIMDLCKSLGVRTSPVKLKGKVWVVPLFGWYQSSFDTMEGSGEYPASKDQWGDFHNCKWPNMLFGEDAICEYFTKMNETRVEQQYDAPVITASHFLPRIDLLPARYHLHIKYLPKVMGSIELERQLRSIHSTVHLFGHSHINWNSVKDGVHYIQSALRYPRERKTYSTTTNMLDFQIWEEDWPDSNMHAHIKSRRGKY